LFFVKMEAGNQVLPGIVVDLDSHDTCRRISDLAVSHEA
jgi:hypothetical protein